MGDNRHTEQNKFLVDFIFLVFFFKSHTLKHSYELTSSLETGHWEEEYIMYTGECVCVLQTLIEYIQTCTHCCRSCSWNACWEELRGVLGGWVMARWGSGVFYFRQCKDKSIDVAEWLRGEGVVRKVRTIESIAVEDDWTCVDNWKQTHTDLRANIEQLGWLYQQAFDIVSCVTCSCDNVHHRIEWK